MPDSYNEKQSISDDKQHFCIVDRSLCIDKLFSRNVDRNFRIDDQHFRIDKQVFSNEKQNYCIDKQNPAVDNRNSAND